MIDLYPLNSQNSMQTVGPTSINNIGQIASGVVSNDIYYPSILDSNTNRIAMLGSIGGVTSYGFNGAATSINKLGQAVGYSYIDNMNRHAFLYSNSVMKDIGTFGGYSSASAINDAGMIVGFASDLYYGRTHAFVYANGLMTDIDPYLDFSRSESYARDVNNRGQVVGEFLTEDQSATHAFMFSKGVFTDLGTASSPYTAALAINDSGQIVGITDIPYMDTCFDYDLGKYIPCIKYKQHAFVNARGQVTDLNTLIAPGSGWELVWAFDINMQGKIVGYGLKNGKFRAFLLTPK
jgi:probable HAF family extracellular repeat protein